MHKHTHTHGHFPCKPGEKRHATIWRGSINYPWNSAEGSTGAIIITIIMIMIIIILLLLPRRSNLRTVAVHGMHGGQLGRESGNLAASSFLSVSQSES